MATYLKDMLSAKYSDGEKLRSHTSVRSKMAEVLQTVKPKEMPWFARPAGKMGRNFLSERETKGYIGERDLPDYLNESEQLRVSLKLEATHREESSVMEDGIFTFMVWAWGYEKIFTIDDSPKHSNKRIFNSSNEVIEDAPFDVAVGEEIIALLSFFDRFGK